MFVLTNIILEAELRKIYLQAICPYDLPKLKNRLKTNKPLTSKYVSFIATYK